MQAAVQHYRGTMPLGFDPEQINPPGCHRPPAEGPRAVQVRAGRLGTAALSPTGEYRSAQHQATPVSASQPREFFIQGITGNGREFRPSDWSERLAGALSSIRPLDGNGSGGLDRHIGYSPYCIPRVIDGVKCVIVSEALRGLEPMAWDFAMNFARDNDLKVVEAGVVQASPPSKD